MRRRPTTVLLLGLSSRMSRQGRLHPPLAGNLRSCFRSSFADESDSNQWMDARLQPIQVVVDEGHVSSRASACQHLLCVQMYDSQQPSTSSSILSATPYDSQQDTKVIARVHELRSQGLWSETRLPICVVPPRPKTHWDFLLEEVRWMWKDFRQERYIKRHWSKKVKARILRLLSKLLLRFRSMRWSCASIVCVPSKRALRSPRTSRSRRNACAGSSPKW